MPGIGGNILKKYPDSPSLKQKLQDLKSKYIEKVSTASREAVEKDISFMRGTYKVDPHRFMQHSGRHLKFEGVDDLLSDEEIAKKLSEAEKNYLLQGPEFTKDDIDDTTLMG